MPVTMWQVTLPGRVRIIEELGQTALVSEHRFCFRIGIAYEA